MMGRAVKVLAAAVGLVVVAYAMNGAYVYLDARNSPPVRPKARPAFNAPVSSATSPTATSPWAENYAKFRRAEYGALLDNAWASPEAESMTMAAKALSECDLFLYPEMLAKSMKKIEAATPAERDRRLKSLEVLHAPCRALEGRPEILPSGEYRSRLYEAARNGAYDKLLKTLWQGSPREREARIREVLASGDPFAISHVVGYLTGPDATFEGERLSFLDRFSYRLAWHQVMCANYDECFTPESRQFHLACVYHGECTFISPELMHSIFFPGLIFGDRADVYYRRIQAHLDRRRYDAFGLLPRP